MTPGQRADALIEDNIEGVAKASLIGDARFGRGCYHVWVLDLADAHAMRIARQLANTPGRRRSLEDARLSGRVKCVCVAVQVEVSERLANVSHAGMGRDMAQGPGPGCFIVAAPVVGGASWCEFEHMEAEDED